MLNNPLKKFLKDNNTIFENILINLLSTLIIEYEKINVHPSFQYLKINKQIYRFVVEL